MPSWNDVKKVLSGCDRAGLFKVLQDLYHLDNANQSFFHVRFLPNNDALEKYKSRIQKNLSPSFGKSVSISEAKKALSEYRKALGRPSDMLELHVFWCEIASSFIMEHCYEAESYFSALLLQFELALKQLSDTDEATSNAVASKLVDIRNNAEYGYGVQYEMDHLLRKHGVKQSSRSASARSTKP